MECYLGSVVSDTACTEDCLVPGAHSRRAVQCTFGEHHSYSSQHPYYYHLTQFQQCQAVDGLITADKN